MTTPPREQPPPPRRKLEDERDAGRPPVFHVFEEIYRRALRDGEARPAPSPAAGG